MFGVAFFRLVHGFVGVVFFGVGFGIVTAGEGVTFPGGIFVYFGYLRDRATDWDFVYSRVRGRVGPGGLFVGLG